MKCRLGVYIVLWCGNSLWPIAFAIGFGWYLDGGNVPPETVVSVGLLVINALFFIAPAVFSRLGPPWSHPQVGLVWLGMKLFVNTFTIFLFIGLQAGRTDVFVKQFFGAYFWLLPGSLWLLSIQPRRVSSDDDVQHCRKI